MIIHFWGVRGSLPTPVTSQQIQSKIMAAIQRITPEDIVSTESRAKFLSNLPSWIFGTTGGNTSCVEVISNGNKLIFDAGTGIRLLGKKENLSEPNTYNLFFSHFHWDHIQGLPFFEPVYNPQNTFNIYSSSDDAEAILRNQMGEPEFPAEYESFSKKITYNKMEPGKKISIGNTTILNCKMSHPGDSYSYAVIENDKKFVYATDVELKSKDFIYSKENEEVFKDADCICLDSQYTVEEAYEKENWGHSAFCFAIDFAVHFNIKKLFLFHHEPTYDDKKLDKILQAAKWYAHYITHSEIEIFLAKEDMEITI